MKRILLGLFLSLATASGLDAGTVTVASQADFDGLNVRLRKLIQSGDRDIRVRFQPGTYFFQEQHLAFMGLENPEVSISFEGEGARLTAAGKDYASVGAGRWTTVPFEGPFEVSHGFVDMKNGRNLDFRTEVRQARRRPEIVDRAQGLCRILTGEPSLSAREAAATWIVLTQWYRSNCYKVEKIERGYVYFRSPNLTDDRNPLTDIDSDFKYGRVLPRYLLYNVKSGLTPYIRGGQLYLPGQANVHECEASRFLLVSGSAFKSLSIQGFTFLGNAAGESLMKFYRSRIGSFSITGCTFEGVRSDCLLFQFTPGCTISDNTFLHCYRNCIEIGFESDRTEVTDCLFQDTGLALDNSACVRNQASGIRIARNRFVDFSYCAVLSGIHYTETMSDRCSSVIEDNEMYQTPEFRKAPSRTLMDSGAIYLGTISQGQVVRNNYIHDIVGATDNRGIFLDDGAVHAEVYGNLVIGIANSYCIDSRRTRWVETHPRTRIDRVNVDNYIGENWVDGPVRFETRGGNDGCRKGRNTQLKSGFDREKTVREWRNTR